MSSTEEQFATNQLQDNHQKPYAELIDEIIVQLEAFFASHLDDLFQQADNHLFTAADEATNTDEQNSLFECMTAVRSHKKTIQQSFVNELSFYLQPMSSLEKPKTLGLVEENVMDEMVLLNSISSKAEMDHAEAINNLIMIFFMVKH